MAREGQTQAVLLLMEYGANINLKTANGYTALGAAKQRDNEEIVRILVKAGAKE